MDNDTEIFEMDDLGNRDGNQTLRDEGTVHFAVDTATNRYDAIDSASLDYDAAGNLTTDKDGYVHVYDYENRISQIKNSSDALIATFEYDALGRRVKVTDVVANTTTYYYYSDNWQVLAEHNGTAFTNRYVFGNYIDEVLVMNNGTNDYYYLHDHLYSAVALLNEAGSVLERYEYDAYGKAIIWNAGLTATCAVSQYGNSYLFTGRRLDTLDNGNLSQYYYRHRYYGADTGRFLQPDPFGTNPAGGHGNPFNIYLEYDNGLNPYQYVESKSTIAFDPLGLRWLNPVTVISRQEVPVNEKWDYISWPIPIPDWWIRTIDLPMVGCKCQPKGQYIQWLEIESGSHQQKVDSSWVSYKGKKVCWELKKEYQYDHKIVGGEVVSSTSVDSIFRPKQCRYEVQITLQDYHLEKEFIINQINSIYRTKEDCERSK